MGKRIAINGFGRIGRLVLRQILQQSDLEVVAINDLVPADNLAYLFKYDTVHGQSSKTVSSEENALIVNGRKIPVTACKDINQLPWKQLQVDYVVESTGHFTKVKDAQGHLNAGAKRVLISAPSDDAPTFVMGVNHLKYDSKNDFILSNASCTTNCLAPLCKVLMQWGIEEGLMSTIHSLTATQLPVDGPSPKDWRSGRAASYNIIPHSTGAAKAVIKCLPELEGKLTGMAFRIPTLDVSAVDLTVRLSKETTLEEIHTAMDIAAAGELKGILATTDEKIVSSDLIGNTHSCIYDKRAGIALNKKFYKLIAWYDNEMGYARRLVDMLEYLALRE